jgi:outer membrane immunogenic protein
MKRFVFAVLALSVITLVNSPVRAGSDYGSDKKAVVTQTAPSLYNWTGFYIGAQGGYTYGRFDPDLRLGGDWSTFPEDRAELSSRGSEALDANGGNLGGVLGYNYQMDHWVFGLEASGSYLWLRNSRDVGTFTVPASENTYNVSTSFKTHYLTTVAPRIGYAWGRFLPYVTGGLALGDLDFSQQIDEHNVFFREGGNHSQTNAGWMVGGGLQYGITDHWSVRAQYEFIDLGHVDFDTKGTAPFHDFTGNSKASLMEHNATAALMYKF